jgi:uncharacterized membrane protein
MRELCSFRFEMSSQWGQRADDLCSSLALAHAVIANDKIDSDAHTEDGIFVPRFFVFMESLVLGIIALLFYLYSSSSGFWAGATD